MALTSAKTRVASRHLADPVARTMLVSAAAGRPTHYMLPRTGWGSVPSTGAAGPGVAAGRPVGGPLSSA